MPGGRRIRPGGPFLVAPLLIAGSVSDAVLRAPLYVCAPAPKPTLQIEHAPNLAVNASVASPGRVVPGVIEPTFTVRVRQPPELSPNLAIRLAAFQASPIDDVALERKPAQQPQLYPNLAVSVSSVILTPRPQQDAPTRSMRVQPEIYPNLAARVSVISAMVPAPLDPLIRRTVVGIDLYPNLAVRFVATSGSLTQFIDPVLTAKGWLEPELYPNLAAPAQITLRPQPQQDAPTRGQWVQPEVYPNLSVQVTVAPAVIPPPLDPLIRRSVTGVDLYPNLAIRFVATVQPRAVPIEPWTNKRFPPQIEFYQNVAVGAPPPIVPAFVVIEPFGAAREQTVFLAQVEGNVFRANLETGLFIGVKGKA